MIITKFLGPTNTKGARVKAVWGDASVTLPFDYELNERDNAARVAQALCTKLEFTGPWVYVGATREGYAFQRACAVATAFDMGGNA